MAGSNSPFSSGSSISSLMRSATSAADKIQSYWDAVAAYQWDNSVKSYQDFLDYSTYLDGKMTSTTDPMTSLTYQKKIDSARSGYISNEIQRQSINVIEGAGSNIDKYGQMTELYYQAADAGQYDLAQSLRLQLDNLSVTIQNEQKAAMAGSSAYSAEVAKSIDNQVKDAVQTIQDNADGLTKEFQRLGDAGFQAEYGTDLFSALSNMVSSGNPDNPGIMDIYNQAAGMTPDPSKASTYQKEFNSLANGGTTDFELPGVGKLTMEDLQSQLYAKSVGQNLFDPVQTAEGTQYRKNVVSGYQYGRDENGQWNLIPIYAAQQDFTANIAGQKSFNGKDGLLAKNGFQVTDTGNNLTVRNTGQFDQFGIPRNEQVQLYMGADGNLQFVKDNQSYTMNFDTKTGKFLNASAESPDIINLFDNGKATARFNNRYLAGKDLSNLPGGSIGLIDTTSRFAKGMEAGPLGRNNAQIQTPTGMIQNAARVQSPAIPSIQAPVTGNSILSAPANATISIAKPQPLPKIVMPTTKPLPKITVAPSKNNQTISLSTGGYTGPGIKF